MAKKLKLLIVSDLHIQPKLKKNTTYVQINDTSSINPLKSIIKTLSDERIKPDIVVCPGDIGDKADPDALKYGWQKLVQLTQKVKAGKLIATAGNHDIDSRFANSKWDPLENVKALRPYFPVNSQSKHHQYWSKHFVVLDGESARFVILNSCAYHSYSGKETDHGRIAPATLSAIRDDLIKLQSRHPKEINILLCHHHPTLIPYLCIEDYNQLRLGENLLSLLGSGEIGQWFVIHGHIHMPNIMYAQGGMTSATVLSAGSFSAHLWAELQGRARNQFYYVELESQGFGPLYGKGRAWDWTPAIGWTAATPESGLPSTFGFGARLNIGDLAKRLSRHIKPIMEWKDFVKLDANIERLLPQDLTTLLKELQRLGINHDHDGINYRQVGKKSKAA
jgi:3',5'-cyclic AMP phosphodiesterase CpdA